MKIEERDDPGPGRARDIVRERAGARGAQLASVRPIREGDREWVIPASDSRGHSALHHFRAQPSFSREIEVLLASKRFPWKTLSDFFRWAVRLGVDVASEELSKDEGSRLADVTSISRVQTEIVRSRQEMVEFRAAFEDLARIVADLSQAGESGEARRMLLEVQAGVMKLGRTTWRDRWLEEYSRRFGGMLRGADLKPGGPGANDED